MRLADQLAEDEDYDRRPQRRRYEEPLFVLVRRQLLTLAESVRSFCLPARNVYPEMLGWRLTLNHNLGCETS